MSRDRGWEFGGGIVGHLVGEFPQEKIADDDIESYVAAGVDDTAAAKGPLWQALSGILEVHLVDPSRGYGGFYEELLDVAVETADRPNASKST